MRIVISLAIYLGCVALIMSIGMAMVFVRMLESAPTERRKQIFTPVWAR